MDATVVPGAMPTPDTGSTDEDSGCAADLGEAARNPTESWRWRWSRAAKLRRERQMWRRSRSAGGQGIGRESHQSRRLVVSRNVGIGGQGSRHPGDRDYLSDVQVKSIRGDIEGIRPCGQGGSGGLDGDGSEHQVRSGGASGGAGGGVNQLRDSGGRIIAEHRDGARPKQARCAARADRLGNDHAGQDLRTHWKLDVEGSVGDGQGNAPGSVAQAPVRLGS